MPVPTSSLAFVPRSVQLRRRVDSPAVALPMTIPLQFRLRSELQPLVESFLGFCNKGAPIAAVEPRTEVSVFEPSVAEHYKELQEGGAQLYTICDEYASGRLSVTPAEQRRFADDSNVREELRKGAVAYCKCADAVYCLWPALEDLFKDNSEIAKIEWARQVVRPRRVFFYEREIGNERIFDHDFIIIHARNGGRFVCDPTGDQFGFSDFFYTWKQYEEKCLDRTFERETVDPDQMFAEFRHDAGRDRYLKELLEFQEGLRAKAKRAE